MPTHTEHWLVQQLILNFVFNFVNNIKKRGSGSIQCYGKKHSLYLRLANWMKVQKPKIHFSKRVNL